MSAEELLKFCPTMQLGVAYLIEQVHAQQLQRVRLEAEYEGAKKMKAMLDKILSGHQTAERGGSIPPSAS